MAKNLYFDYNATTPVHPEIRKQLPSWSEIFGNPSSTHSEGRLGKQVIRDSRKIWESILNVPPLTLFWTPCGTYGNNLALRGVWKGLQELNSSRKTILISPVEHPSILAQIPALEKQGAKVKLLKLKDDFSLDEKYYQELLETEEVALVSIMYANNETGQLFPIKKLCALAHQHGAYFHSDMIQILGKLPIDLKDLGVDLASFSAHKVYALKGCGMIYIKNKTPFTPLLFGGNQERGTAPGTENPLAIQSFGYIGSLMKEEGFALQKQTHLKNLQRFFETKLKEALPDTKIVSENQPRTGGISCVILPSPYESSTWVMNLDIEKACISGGSACQSGKVEPNKTLTSMGFSEEDAKRVIRISYGWFTTEEELEILVQKIKTIFDRLKSCETAK